MIIYAHPMANNSPIKLWLLDDCKQIWHNTKALLINMCMPENRSNGTPSFNLDALQKQIFHKAIRIIDVQS